MRVLLLMLALLLPLACGSTTPPEQRRADPTLSTLDRLSEEMELLGPGASWRSVTTSSFRVLYLSDEPVARQVADAAEKTRTRQQRLWHGGAARAPWSPRCDIYLYPSNRLLVQMSGGDAKSGSAAARPSRLLRGRMLQRRMNLAADDWQLLDSTLPHEVSHIIVAQLLGDRPVPLWANEGLAMLNETKRSRRRFERVLQRYRVRGQLFPLRTLTSMERYPDAEFNRLYYAQSLGLVRFLLSLGDRSQLLSLLRAGIGPRVVEQALRQHYGVGFEELTRGWLQWLSSADQAQVGRDPADKW